MTIPMRRVECIDGGQPGDFAIDAPNEWNKGFIHFVCPNGRNCGVGLRNGEYQGGQPHPSGVGTTMRRWGFNGSCDRPSLTPSINCCSPTGCGWHGFITNGEMK